MEYIFLSLTILTGAGLLVGLIRPGLVAPGGRRATRGRVFIGYGVAAVVSLALFVMTAESSLWRGIPLRDLGAAPAPAPAIKSKFSLLSIDTVTAESGKVTVAGTTDLPEGSRLSVDYDVAGLLESESDIAVGEETTVKNGQYTVAITPPRIPAFARGPYAVTVLFSPRIQSGEVLRKVGTDGENLSGPAVLETFGFQVLHTKKEVTGKR